ncbi:Flp pilus assembly protein CpaB [Nocardioides panacisoli]|uniref:Flp pilus assembly protein CpaB n=1 Tax=Nocardioides panacisoli TaxID=627624 RepID=UPI0031D9B831
MSSRDPDSPRRRVRDLLGSARRAVLRRRRLLAALCAAGAVLAAVRVAAPPAPATVDLVVAARDLPAGTVLSAEDLRTTRVAAGAVPADVVAAPAGATLAAPLREGEAVTDVRLVGPGLAAPDPGRVAVPVRFSDAGQAALLGPGDRVDVLATDPEQRTTSTVASDAVVLATPGTQDDTGALTGRVVVLGVTPAEVEQVTSSAVTAFVTYAWRNQ